MTPSALSSQVHGAASCGIDGIVSALILSLPCTKLPRAATPPLCIGHAHFVNCIPEALPTNIYTLAQISSHTTRSVASLPARQLLALSLIHLLILSLPPLSMLSLPLFLSLPLPFSAPTSISLFLSPSLSLSTFFPYLPTLCLLFCLPISL